MLQIVCLDRSRPQTGELKIIQQLYPGAVVADDWSELGCNQALIVGNADQLEELRQWGRGGFTFLFLDYAKHKDGQRLVGIFENGVKPLWQNGRFVSQPRRPSGFALGAS